MIVVSANVPVAYGSELVRSVRLVGVGEIRNRDSARGSPRTGPRPNSPIRVQLQLAYPCGDIEPDLALHRQRLQRDCPVRSTDQDVSAETGGNGYFRRRPGVCPGEHSGVAVRI